MNKKRWNGYIKIQFRLDIFSLPFFFLWSFYERNVKYHFQANPIVFQTVTIRTSPNQQKKQSNVLSSPQN